MSDASSTLPTTRSKRFERGEAPPIELTDRDLSILRALRRLRFADSAQLHKLVGGSQQTLLRRLKALYDAGYIDRPRAQLAQLHVKGNRATVYALGRKGARALRENEDAPILNWTLKNNRSGAVFIEHTIITSHFLIDVTLAARQRGLTLLDHADLLPFMPEKTQRSANPFSWRVSVKRDGKTIPLSVVPDRIFSLVHPDDTRQSFALEIDTGAMPVNRASFNGTSIARKIHAYWEGHQKHLEQQRWGFSSFFVLFVLPSNERLENVIAAQRQIIPNGTRLFLFTTPALLAAQGVFGPAYFNGKGEHVALIS